MKKHHIVLEGALVGYMLGYSTSQWFHSAQRTIFGMPARVVYSLGGIVALFVILIMWLTHRWEE